MKKFLSIAAISALMVSLFACQPQKEGAKDSSEAKTENTQLADSPAKGSIVYFNLDKVLLEYDMSNDLKAVVEAKIQSISQEVNRRQSKLEQEIKTFQDKINKGLLVSSVAQQQQEKLGEKQIKFQNYAAEKQQEIAEEQTRMMNQIADAINTYIATFNEQKGYALILSTQGDILPVPVVAGDPSLDITDELLDGLNKEYVKSKNEDKDDE